jgi:hypothetical protein
MANKTDYFQGSFGHTNVLMTREKWAAAIGLPATVVIAQAEKGYWPLIHIGKRVFVNVEAVRIAASKKEFTL